jgi:succinoglycan biosynthesis protein ExoM
VVVADNDREGSGESTVAEIATTTPLRLVYCIEPEQNIALARNKALEQAQGDFIAFIDDDEHPGPEWLSHLFMTCVKHGVDGVLGPVMAHFEREPPEWVKKGKFFDRPTHATGYRMDWEEARSGNVLFRRGILADVQPAFRPLFDTAGEDVDFFRRLMENGRSFIWCKDAIVHESVPPSRCTRRYLLRRAMLRGSNFPKHPRDRVKNAIKSVVAIPCYTLALPILALAGHHVLVAYLIKICDHTSRLAAFLGLAVVTQRQT